MSRRRMIVAFEEVENAQSRMWRQLGAGYVTEEDRAGRKHRLGRYWCAADRPDIDVTPVYRTRTVPEDARCRGCGIRIRELQEELTRLIDGR